MSRADGTPAGRGQPSWVWRAGQDRRFAMIESAASLEGTAALDVGCGIGLYGARLERAGAHAFGVEVDLHRARRARTQGATVAAAVAERLPFPDGSFDLVLLHEVLEHVSDDRATAAEALRVLRPGGRAIIFAPNRWWPLETHGMMWRGRYRFGNMPIINYLPDPFRNRLAPHVRTYTRSALRALFRDGRATIVHHSRIFPGYDKLGSSKPRLGRILRRVTYALEGTPLECFGLSHLLVVERSAADGATRAGPAGGNVGGQPSGPGGH